MALDRSLITMEYKFKCDRDTLWKAITQHDQMIQWYFENIPSFEANVGFKTSFLVRSTTLSFTHNWEVTQVVEGKKIAYAWTYNEYNGKSISVFDILNSEDCLILKITILGLNSFPGSIEEFKAESCVGGWNYFIQDRLKSYIRSQTS